MSAPFKKNAVLWLDIEDLTFEGLGVGRVEGFALFVPDALPGERCQVKVLKVMKRFGYAKILRRANDSPDRVPVRDPLGFSTGTMPLQHMTYPAQLRFKEALVRRQLEQVQKIDPSAGETEIDVLPILPAKQIFSYRNKAQIPVRNVEGRLEIGLFRKNSHRLVATEHFSLHTPEIDRALFIIRDILREHDLVGYDEEAHSGDVRHLVVRHGITTGELLVILVTRTDFLPRCEAIVTALRQALPTMVGLVQNINDERTNVILGRNFKILYGRDYYQESLCGLLFRISAASFFQVNTEQAEHLYRVALDFAQLVPADRLLDAYCGIGTIGLIAAPHVASVHGIEIVPQAIDMARKNADLNAIANACFTAGDVPKILMSETRSPDTTAVQQMPQAYDVVVVDPPRKGLADAMLQWLLIAQPNRIVYVSCNPFTLARDLKHLCAEHYRIRAVQPVDLFPQTHHVETVVLMSKVEK